MEKENEERINQLLSEKHELERKWVSFTVGILKSIEVCAEKKLVAYFFHELLLCGFCLLQRITWASSCGSVQGSNATNGVVVASFPRMRGFGENVRQFIPRLCFFFFFKWKLARANLFYSLDQDQPTVA